MINSYDMVVFDENEYELRKSAFYRECDRVRPRKGSKLTTNLELLADYKTSLVRTYNDLLRYIFGFIAHATLEEKIDYQQRCKTNLEKLEEAFDRLSLSYPFNKSKYSLIDITKVTDGEEIDSELEEQSQSNKSQNSEAHVSNEVLNSPPKSQERPNQLL